MTLMDALHAAAEIPPFALLLALKLLAPKHPLWLSYQENVALTASIHATEPCALQLPALIILNQEFSMEHVALSVIQNPIAQGPQIVSIPPLALLVSVESSETAAGSAKELLIAVLSCAQIWSAQLEPRKSSKVVNAALNVMEFPIAQQLIVLLSALLPVH